MTAQDIDYETAKGLARSPDLSVRRRLASNPSIRAELLYFLATDKAAEVRRAIADNASTPRQADALLARDTDLGVRSGLARKLARLVPEMSQERRDQIERLTLEVMDTLARDQATEVREVLAQELQHLPGAPSAVINRLARDVEVRVCGPVLRNSPILTDDDLLEIIFGGSPRGALSEIAQRKTVPSHVADAIAAADDVGAITHLLANPSAQIREETLDRLVTLAPNHEPWHAPLVRRPALPGRLAAKLAVFVADNLLQVLKSRTDLGPEVSRSIAEMVRTRLARSASGVQGESVEAAAARVAAQEAAAQASEKEPAKTPEKPAESPVDRAHRLNAEGKLDEAVLNIALTEGDRLMVLAGLAELAGTEVPVVERVMATRNGKVVTALVWRSGLTMRFARQVQLRIAQIPPKQVLNARDGIAYPMSEKDMRWQLEFFGIGVGEGENA